MGYATITQRCVRHGSPHGLTHGQYFVWFTIAHTTACPTVEDRVKVRTRPWRPHGTPHSTQHLPRGRKAFSFVFNLFSKSKISTNIFGFQSSWDAHIHQRWIIKYCFDRVGLGWIGASVGVGWRCGCTDGLSCGYVGLGLGWAHSSHDETLILSGWVGSTWVALGCGTGIFILECRFCSGDLPIITSWKESREYLTHRYVSTMPPAKMKICILDDFLLTFCGMI